MENELIGCTPRKRVYPGRGRRNVAPPFSSLRGPNGPTEREQIASRVMQMDTTEDGHGHLFTHSRVLVSWHVLNKYRSCWVGCRGPGFCVYPNTFFYTRTERMTTCSLGPFRSFPCSLERVKTRPYEVRKNENIDSWATCGLMFFLKPEICVAV